jgi:hypothetical protein
MGRKSFRKKHRPSVLASPASTTLQMVAYSCLAIGIASFGRIAQFCCIDNTRNGSRLQNLVKKIVMYSGKENEEAVAEWQPLKKVGRFNQLINKYHLFSVSFFAIND